MGYIEKRGKNSWRLYTQVNVAGQMQPVRVTLRMDPSLPESVQRRDAQRELRLLEARLAGASSDVPTLQQWSDSWLANMDPETSPVTVANYKYLLSSRILPQLGPLPLPDLTPTRLTEWLRAIRTDPRKSTRKEEKDLSRPRRKGEKLIPASRQAKPLSETLEVYDFSFPQISDNGVHIGVIGKAQNVVIGRSGFLLSAHIFGQISDHITFDTDCGCRPREAGSRGRIDACRMVDKISVKSALFNLLRGQVSCQLMKNGAYHFQMT